MLLRRKIRVLLTFLWIFLIIAVSSDVSAQDNPPTVLQAGMILLTTTYKDLQILDPNTGELHPFAGFVKPTYGIKGVIADGTTQKLYFLDTPGEVGHLGWVVEFNAVTGKSAHIFERANFSEFIPSPDYQRAIVTYFRGDLTHYPPNAPLLACILDLQTHVCTDIVLPFDINFTFKWVSNDSFFLLYLRQIYAADKATDFKLHLLSNIPLVINFVPIPGTDSLLFNGISGASSFTYSLGTSAITPYNLKGVQANQTSEYGYLAFSPDGNYLLTISSDDTHPVFDVRKGVLTVELPAQFNAPYVVLWMPDSRHIVGIYYETLGQNPGQIMEYDVETGERQALYTFSELPSFWIVR